MLVVAWVQHKGLFCLGFNDGLLFAPRDHGSPCPSDGARSGIWAEVYVHGGSGNPEGRHHLRVGGKEDGVNKSPAPSMSSTDWTHAITLLLSLRARRRTDATCRSSLE